MRPVDFFVLLDECQDGDGLDGFAETHIIGQDTADAALIETDHPVQPHQLVVLQHSASQHCRLFSKPSEDVLLLLLLFDHYLDLFVLLLEMPSFLGFWLRTLPQYLMLRQQEVGIILSLLD